MEKGWHYDVKTNAIRFEENNLPNEGEKVEVHYNEIVKGS